MVNRKKDDSSNDISILEVKQTQVTFNIFGMSPLVPHAMSFKAASELLFPSPRKNAAEKAVTMKHDPFQEFLDAAYKFNDDDEPTRLYLPGSMFHMAMANAAIDMEGAKKAQIGRLTSIVGDKVPLWGIPKIYSTVVRSADQNRTPDIRTLPILVEWATQITVEFVVPLIKTASVGNLLGAAGVFIGVGDGRPQKGKLNFGKFRVATPGDPDFDRVMKYGGRKAQDEALADPAYYDLETKRLLTWFDEEKSRRIASPSGYSGGKGKGKKSTDGAATQLDA